MYFYAEYGCIFSDFSKAIIFLKKIIDEKISFSGSGGGGGEIRREVSFCIPEQLPNFFLEFQEWCIVHYSQYYNGGTICHVQCLYSQ